jgi:hypothetical protein
LAAFGLISNARNIISFVAIDIVFVFKTTLSRVCFGETLSSLSSGAAGKSEAD